MALCDGQDMELSRELEVDTLTWMSEADKPREAVAMIKGHPHADEAAGRQAHFPGMAADADEALRKWTEESDGD